MVWWVIWQVFTTLFELAQLGRKSESEKDLEILLLRRQLAIYERKETKAPRLTKGEKLTLIVLAGQLKTKSRRTIRQMGQYIRVVKPTRCLGGMASWYVGNGPTKGRIGEDVREKTKSLNCW